jgi:hypothetical protein
MALLLMIYQKQYSFFILLFIRFFQSQTHAYPGGIHTDMKDTFPVVIIQVLWTRLEKRRLLMLLQTLPGHSHQPGSVCLRHLGEALIACFSVTTQMKYFSISLQ